MAAALEPTSSLTLLPRAPKSESSPLAKLSSPPRELCPLEAPPLDASLAAERRVDNVRGLRALGGFPLLLGLSRADSPESAPSAACSALLLLLLLLLLLPPPLLLLLLLLPSSPLLLGLAPDSAGGLAFFFRGLAQVPSRGCATSAGKGIDNRMPGL